MRDDEGETGGGAAMGRKRVSGQAMAVGGAILGLAAVFLTFTLWDRGGRGPLIVATDPTLVTVVVEVRGAVVRPGVYSLAEDGRLGQLVEMAGGVTADADLRRLNLARRLADEELVVVPSLSATPVVGPGEADVQPAQTSGGGGLVDLNVATQAELEALPGIGEVLATRILAYREANGPFGRVEDLDAVDGISQGLIEELRDLVTVGP